MSIEEDILDHSIDNPHPTVSRVLDALGMDPSGRRKGPEETVRTLARLAKLLKQSKAREESALEQVAEMEERIDAIKRRAQNNIDRAYNRGVALPQSAGLRKVRHPEHGTA